jgi:hypothetical protein
VILLLETANVIRIGQVTIAIFANVCRSVTNQQGLGVIRKQVHAFAKANGQGSNATSRCVLGNPSVEGLSRVSVTSESDDVSASDASQATTVPRCAATLPAPRMAHVRRKASACA